VAVHDVPVDRKVAGAYATLKANITAGNLGPTGSKRRQAAEGKPIQFRRDAAQPYDDRCLSWRLADRTVSIWTVTGRSGPIRLGAAPLRDRLGPG
jgi:putative transposase